MRADRGPDEPPFDAVLVGCGPRGLEHAAALASVSGLELRAVCEPDPHRREQAAAAFGVPGFTTIEEALDPPPAVVVLATPPSGRAALAERAAAAGARIVLTEKPMALRLAEAREMVEACERHGAYVAVGHQLRHGQEFEEVRRAIADGTIGELEFVRGVAFGNLLDQGPHVLDLMRWLLGGPEVRWAMAQRGDAAMAGMAAQATPPASPAHPAPPWMACYLAFESGARGVLETGGLYQRARATVDDWLGVRVVVTGTEGTAEAHVARGWRIARVGGGPVDEGTTDVEDWRAATAALHADLRDALREGRRPRTDGRDALSTLEGLLACAQSAVDGDAAVLPLDPERDPVAELDGAPTAGRRPGRRAPAGEAHAPDVSIVVPLPDHRGLASRCVTSWVAEQTLAPERFELIVVADGSEPDVEAEVESLLRPGDRILREPPASEIELYDAGVRSARGRWALITEPHCLAEPRCVEELLRFLEGSEYDGAALRSTGLPGNALARMEERMFNEGFEDWSREGHWCKVLLRGFAVRTDTYAQVGGFEVAYSRFAEYLLGAQLHAAGKRIGYAPGAAVRHLYTPSLRALVPPVSDFSRGEVAFLAERGDDELARYFDTPPELTDPWLDRLAAATLGLAALRAVPRGGPGTAAFARAAARGILTALVGPRPRVAAARVRFHLADARCALLAFSRERRYRAYRDAYSRIAALGRLQELSSRSRPEPGPAPSTRSIAFGDLPEARLLGFHPVERMGEAVFRWTGAVAQARLPLAAGEWELRLDTGGLRPDAEPALWLDGRRLGAVREGNLLRADVRVKERPDHVLTVACAPWRQWRLGSPDRRELGLPLVGLELVSGAPEAQADSTMTARPWPTPMHNVASP